MIRKKPLSSTDEDEVTIPEEPKKSSYVEIPMPRISTNNFNPLLIITLLVAAYFLGVLTTKVQYLEKNKTASATDTAQVTTNTGTQPPAAQPTTPQKVQATVGHLPILGNKDAKVTIIEFSDFQCPFCKQFFDTTLSQLKKDYVDTGKAKLAYRHYPLTSIHPNAQKAAEAAECANEQGKFWEFHDTLFKNQDTWAPQSSADAVTSFTNYAGDLGMDTGQFADCVNTDKYLKAVTDDAADAQKAYVTATPSFVINDELLVGALPFPSFQASIDSKLK